MKKLNLDLDQLTVESFSPAAAPAAFGTVRAHEGTDPYGDCWTGTEAQPSDFGACDTYDCGGGPGGPSHAPSCGQYCDITGYWKCEGDYTTDF